VVYSAVIWKLTSYSHFPTNTKPATAMLQRTKRREVQRFNMVGPIEDIGVASTSTFSRSMQERAGWRRVARYFGFFWKV